MKPLYRAGSAVLCLGGAMAALVISAVPEDVAAQGRGRRQAQPAKEGAAPSAGQLDRARGAKEAPAAVQAASLRCSVTEAAFLGVSGGRNAYEVACREGLGFIVVNAPAAGGQATTLDCVSAQTTARVEQAAGRPPGQQCRLPANAQPAQGLAGVAREAGVTCTVTNGRAIGVLTGSNAIRYEVGCSEGPGYVLDRPQAGGRPAAQNCFRAEQTSGGQFRCEFTTKAQSLAALNPVITASRRSCTVSDARVVGVNPTTKNEVVEVGCQGAPGFFIETAATGAFVGAYDCGRFGNTPCQFTAASAVQERNAQDYGRLLKAANFDCAVSNFKRLGSEQGTGREIVEVACSNRPEGAFALLATGSGPSEVYDCLLAQKRRQNCTLTSEEALYPRIESAMTAQRRACDITMSRRMGTTPEGEEWYEFACAQGRNRVVDYRGNGRVVKVLDCREGALVLGGCKLPGAGPAAAGATRR